MKRIILDSLLLVMIILIGGCSKEIIHIKVDEKIETTRDTTLIEPTENLFEVRKEDTLRETVSINNQSEKKFFDWNVWLVGCVECNKLEIIKFRDRILLALPKGEYQFDGYNMVVDHIPTKFKDLSDNHTINGIYLNLTHEGNNKLNKLNLSEYGVGTVYYKRIIDKNIQAKPKNDTELRYCEEERECIMIGTDCCANANCRYIAINRKFYDYWKSQFNCSGIACIASVCMKTFYVRCLNNQCILVED